MDAGYICTRYPTELFTTVPPSEWTRVDFTVYDSFYNWDYYRINYYASIGGRVYALYSAHTDNRWQTNFSGFPTTKPLTLPATVYGGSDNTWDRYRTPQSGGPYTVYQVRRISFSVSLGNATYVLSSSNQLRREQDGRFVFQTSTSAPKITATVTPNAHFRFVKWIDENTENPREFTLPTPVNDTSVEAVVQQYEWQMSTVSSNSFGVAYIGATGTTTTLWTEAYLPYTIRAEVKTEYAETYKFKKWLLNGYDFANNTSPMIQLTSIEANAVYQAVFIPINYTLNVSSSNADHGSVDVTIRGVKQVTTTGLTVAGLSDVILSANPVFGYVLTGWYSGYSLVSNVNPLSLTMPEANTTIQGVFVELEKASLSVTKTNFSMGIVKLFHLSNVMDTQAGSASETLAANVYVGKEYTLKAETADPIYQFDGWWKTEYAEGEPVVAISLEDTFTFIPTSTVGLVLEARFSARVLSTIEARASDAATYLPDNAAEEDGCSVLIVTEPDTTQEGVDKWLSGQTIEVSASQGFGWVIKAWQAVKKSDGSAVFYLQEGDAGFALDVSFKLPADVYVMAVFENTLPPEKKQIQARYHADSNVGHGVVEVYPSGNDYSSSILGVSANVEEGATAQLTAIPKNGFKFDAWYKDVDGVLTLVSTVPNFSITVESNELYRAKFSQSVGGVYKFDADDNLLKEYVWIGKHLVASVPLNLSCSRVYADSYPVALMIGYASAPRSPQRSSMFDFIVSDQGPKRLPMHRPEKLVSIGIRGSGTVSELSVSTSMEGLRNG